MICRVNRPVRSAWVVRIAMMGALGVFAGCGGSGEPAADPASAGVSSDTAAAIDPCALVTREEAETALDASAAEAERPTEANIPPRLVTCRYVAQRGQGVAVLSVMVRQGTSDSESSIGFRQAKEQFPGAEAVPGLGEDAFWFGNQINVLKGRTYLNIAGDFDLATARGLAATALGRM